MSFHFTEVGSRYGAPMGRTDMHADDRELPIKLHLEHVRLYDGDYDKGGAYWGSGTPLWVAWNDDSDVAFFVRALSRGLAKQSIRASQHIGSAPGLGYTNARFYR